MLIFFLGEKSVRNIESRKNVAAYQVSLSAVKKIQDEKRGIDKAREIRPAIVSHLALCL